MQVEVTKVSSLCDKISTAVGKYETERPLLEILYAINNAIRGIVTVQEGLIQESMSTCHPEVTIDPPATSSSMTDMAQLAKKPRQVPLTDEEVELQQDSRERASFRDAVKAAESSTLVFNLDMGKVPIMNQETMSNKATMALVTMAASREEGNFTSTPCEDTLTAIDDTLSIATKISFYGKKTKSYINPKDHRSGSFCTVPVKYEFRNKETRIEAEKVFMDKCGAHCAIPYPPILRECIKQVVDKVKKDYPDNQVKVAVDTKTLSLRVSRRVKKVENPDKWNAFDVNIPLPKEVLNITARVPQGFKLSKLPRGPSDPDPPQVSIVQPSLDMETDSAQNAV
jgi:hypothetical protein